MKTAGWSLLCVFIAFSCSNKKPIVDVSFADSVISNKFPSVLARSADSNVVFWKRKMEHHPDDFVNGPEYASALVSRFRIFGDIRDLLIADSLAKRSNLVHQAKEPPILRTLASFALLQHQFKQAKDLLQRSMEAEGVSIPNAFTEFDICFERGDYPRAKDLLKYVESGRSFAWLFRKAKYEHVEGSLDAAISYMKQAAVKAGTNKRLKQIALSNAADLCVHNGDVGQAYELYKASILVDASDLHSITGLGWIALIHDKNDRLAEKLFKFVQTQTLAPDILLKLQQLAEARSDSISQVKYATEFVAKATQNSYGYMYAKYLIDQYCGVLNQPAKAITIAESELINRSCPQVYAWYAWSLYRNNEYAKALSIYTSHVAGKPLEAIELYYIGKLLVGLKKVQTGNLYLKAAYKNRFDLGPAKLKDLESLLE